MEFDSSRNCENERGREREKKSDDDVLDGIHFLITEFYTDTHYMNYMQSESLREIQLESKTILDY